MNFSDTQLAALLARYNRYVVRSNTQCWSWTGSISNGYGRFTWWDIDNRVRKNAKAHRVSYLIYKGPITDGLDVMHLCDNRICSNPEHLALGTRKENMAMSKTVGRIARKIPLEDIPLIKLRRANGDSFAKIGRDYGVSHGATRLLLVRNPDR